MKRLPSVTDVKSKINNSIIFGNCRKVDTIFFNLSKDRIFYQYKYYELDDNDRIIYVGESEVITQNIHQPNHFLIKGYKDKEKCPYTTSIKISTSNIEEDGSYDIDIYLEKITVNNQYTHGSGMKYYFQTHKEKINSQCLFGNIIITGSSYLPIITYSEKSCDISSCLSVINLPKTKFNSLNIPMQICETSTTTSKIEKPDDILYTDLKYSFIGKEKIKYNKNGEVIGYENPHTGIKMKLKKRKYGYTEEIYFEDKLISFTDIEDSPTIMRYSKRFLNYIDSYEKFKKDNVVIVNKGPVEQHHVYKIYDICNGDLILSTKDISNYNFYKFENVDADLFYQFSDSDEKFKIKKYENNITLSIENKFLYDIILNCGSSLESEIGKKGYRSILTDKFEISFNSKKDYYHQSDIEYMDNDLSMEAQIDTGRKTVYRLTNSKSKILKNDNELYIRDMFGIPRLIEINKEFDLSKFFNWNYRIIENIVKDSYIRYDKSLDDFSSNIYEYAESIIKKGCKVYSDTDYYDYYTEKLYKISDYINKSLKGDKDAKIEVVDINDEFVGYVWE